MDKSKQELIDMCNSYVKDIEEGGDVSEFLDETLDCEFTIGRDGNYLGARILVAYESYTWIDTQYNTVEVLGCVDVITRSYKDNIGVDDYMEECWNQIKGGK